MNTIRTIAEIEINKQVQNAFIQNLRDQISGFYERGDIEYTVGILEDAERHFPKNWKPQTKQEFLFFLSACAEDYAERFFAPKRGGWHNPASAENGKKGGRPKKDK